MNRICVCAPGLSFARAAALILLLAACDSQDIASSIGGNNTAEGEQRSAEEAAQTIPSDTLNHAHDRLAALSPGTRDVVLTRAINSAGGICNVVDRSFYQG